MGRGEIVGMVSARDLLAVKAWEGIAQILEAETETLTETAWR
jgi:hypothetical protein